MVAYQLLPDLAADDFARLKASIAERGVEVPVIVDEDGAIIDGHNRALIADSLGIDYPKIVRAGLAPHEKRLLAVELNLARRQLTEAQKVLLGKKIEPDIAARARQREYAGKAQDPVDNCPQGTTRDEVARTVGLGSGRTYERAKRVVDAVEQYAPDLLPHVANGDLDLDDARKELKQRGIAYEAPKPTDLPVPGSLAEARQKAAAIFDAMTPEQLAAYDAETARWDERPRLGHDLAGVGVFISRARLALSKIADDTITRHLGDPAIVDQLDRSLNALNEMSERYRALLDASRAPLRRVK